MNKEQVLLLIGQLFSALLPVPRKPLFAEMDMTGNEIVLVNRQGTVTYLIFEKTKSGKWICKDLLSTRYVRLMLGVEKGKGKLPIPAKTKTSSRFGKLK